jgi:hypothetical protein
MVEILADTTLRKQGVPAAAAIGIAAAAENKERRETTPGVVRLSSAIDAIP